MDAERLVLFVDAQNFYNSARRAFFPDEESHVPGQFDPIALGKLLCLQTPIPVKPILHQVRIYTGRPDPNKEPFAYAAHMRQCSAWEKSGACVIARPLRYLSDWPSSKAQQKGVDVAIAIDFVSFAIDGGYDIGIIASLDTDLRPALEYVRSKCNSKCRIKVASWKSRTTNIRLDIPGDKVWCHWLNYIDYQSIADNRDYRT
ncbi:hypothetical protein X792_04825 [Dehalococcoides mccartyi CG1]|jgi:uncharacterized LabA/DUF88 family protein|uniref:NYN domain-containing protein n=1 Tax=Dehalococcoides mccartyi TaxID=61435 RepID=UPI0004E05705|nr:NYN domain-containing protein [Dehalococcoides mccartyi]AII58078.1 hypothetical protein X792_04825 [Dehalococcoides mccartyi CG1]